VQLQQPDSLQTLPGPNNQYSTINGSSRLQNGKQSLGSGLPNIYGGQNNINSNSASSRRQQLGNPYEQSPSGLQKYSGLNSYATLSQQNQYNSLGGAGANNPQESGNYPYASNRQFASQSVMHQNTQP
jgi:hypothetical protein